MAGLSRKQVDQLLAPIKPGRVLKDRDGLSHVSQQDIRAHLTRVFGFGGWSSDVVELACIRDTMKTVPAKNGKPERDVPDVTYRCQLRLTIRDPEGNFLASYEDVGTGTSPNLPTYGDAHDFAAKNAVSYALKRCATNLGDGFGLSLYNKGQLAPLVIDTLVKPADDGKTSADVQAEVPQQVDLGDERPDEPHDDGAPNADDIQSAKARVWAARPQGWNLQHLTQDFADQTDGDLSKASVEALVAYATALEKRANGVHAG